VEKRHKVHFGRFIFGKWRLGKQIDVEAKDDKTNEGMDQRREIRIN
jgi:hypothetical protein